MEPLSLRTRRIVSISFFLLFATVLVVTSFYASGYRIDGWSLEGTGGVYVAVPVSGAEVSVNGEVVGTSGFLTKSFFIDDLAPGSYVLQVMGEGYYPWTKTMIVQRSFVTDTSAFMVPKELPVFEIMATSSKKIATTTRAVSDLEYERMSELFVVSTSTAMQTATTTDEVKVPDLELSVRSGNVYVRWNRELERAPSVFCIAPNACVVEVSVEKSEVEVVDAAFFGGGVVYQTKNSGIFFAEIDVKPTQLVIPLYPSPSAEFALYQDEIVIKDEDDLFVVTGW